MSVRFLNCLKTILPALIVSLGAVGPAYAASCGVTSLQFSAPTYSVNEDAGTATITVTRVGGVCATSVDYVTSDGTAIAGIDYTNTSGTLNWSAGDAADKTFDIPILNDGLVDGNETVNLALTNPRLANLGSPNTAVLTIHETNVPSETPQVPATDPGTTEPGSGNSGSTGSSSGSTGTLPSNLILGDGGCSLIRRF